MNDESHNNSGGQNDKNWPKLSDADGMPTTPVNTSGKFGFDDAGEMQGGRRREAGGDDGAQLLSRESTDYLSQLLRDKQQLSTIPQVLFYHVDRLLDDEINKMRTKLFQFNFNDLEPLELPEPEGKAVLLREKIFIPIKEYPEYNFVGRILGPRGMTAKQLEQETGCKIMVRGNGSMREKRRAVWMEMAGARQMREHVNEDLHVLIQCEDTENRANIKIKRAVEQVNRLLVPSPDGEDDLKRKQLMELAIINGNYRPANNAKLHLQTPRILSNTPLSSVFTSPNSPSPKDRGSSHFFSSPTSRHSAAAVPGNFGSPSSAPPQLPMPPFPLVPFPATFPMPPVPPQIPFPPELVTPPAPGSIDPMLAAALLRNQLFTPSPFLPQADLLDMQFQQMSLNTNDHGCGSPVRRGEERYD